MSPQGAWRGVSSRLLGSKREAGGGYRVAFRGVVKRWYFLEHEGPLAFAHRGGAGEAPENTLKAFGRAVDMGFRYLETDARVSADGVAMVFHDATLDRVTDRTGKVCDLSSAQLKSARVWGREPIPTLEEALVAFPDTRFNIDPKEDAVVEPMAEAIAETSSVKRVCIGAFAGRRLGRLRELLGSDLCHSIGIAGVGRLRLASLGEKASFALSDADESPCVQVPPYVGRKPLVDERFVEAAHRRSQQVHVWVIDEPDEMHRLLDIGVDGIMTDFPSVLKEVYEERGVWR